MLRRNPLLCPAAFTVLALSAVPAHAQSMGTPAPQTPDGGASGSAAPAEGDIVVTAQRTQSLASKTPIALSAIGGDALRTAGITNATALGDQVPNLSIDRTSGLQITIRGITSSDNTEKGDPSAAFLLDGIYIARPQAQEVSFFDIDRVEVLRGPQGTLYGRNTTAGVVNVITRKPGEKFEAAANFSYGNFDTIQADAMVNLPVNDMIALRFAGSYDRRDSYLRTVPGDRFGLDPFKNNLSFRAQALFTFTPEMSLLLKADYSRIRGNDSIGSVSADGRFFAPQLRPDLNDGRYVGGSRSSRDLRTIGAPLGADPSTKNNTWGISGEYNWDFGPLTLTYLGSYRKFKRNETSSNLAANPVAFGEPPRAVETIFTGSYTQQSHELRFATNGDGPLKLQFGGMYFREKSGIAFYLLDLLPGIRYFGFPQDPTISESYGFFGQATYSLTDSLRVTGGVRYSKDNKSREGFTVFQQGPIFNPKTDDRTLNAAKASFSKITWRAGIDYDVNSRTLLYGVVSTGYKAGGFNDGCELGVVTNGVPCVDTPTKVQSRPLEQLYYKPETLTSYEIGLKTRFADNRVRLNLSAFYYDYKNLQLSSVQEFSGAQVQFTTNAGKARVKGVEAEATITPDSRNRVDLSLSWLDAEYTEYSPGALIGNTIIPVDYKGRRLDRSPRIVATAGYAYTYPLGNGGSIGFGVRTRMSDAYMLTAFNVPRQYRQPGFTRTEANLTYTASDSRWYVQVFGKNLENNIAINALNYNTGGSFLTAVPSDPRTYGIRVGVKY